MRVGAVPTEVSQSLRTQNKNGYRSDNQDVIVPAQGKKKSVRIDVIGDTCVEKVLVKQTLQDTH